MDSARKVLLIRLSSLGDVVLATAALEALNRGLPDTAVHVLTKPAFGVVFRNHPGASHTLSWQPSEGIGALARSIRRGEYDWVVDLHDNLRTRLLRLLVRGPRWSVYRKGAIRRRLAVKLGRPGLLGSEHVVDRYVRTLGSMGVEPRRYLPRIHRDPAAAERVT